MSGNTASYEQRGLIPRVLATLLSSLRATPGLASWSLSLSYLEVYNDVLYDLLDINTSPSELTLYEDGGGQLQVCAEGRFAVRNCRRWLVAGTDVHQHSAPLLLHATFMPGVWCAQGVSDQRGGGAGAIL